MGRAGGRVSVLYLFAFARARKLLVLFILIEAMWV